MSEEKELLSEKQVYNVLEFSNGLYNFLGNGVWNPYTQNRNIKDLNNSQYPADYDKIVKALSDVKNNEKMLGSYSQFMKTFDSIYSKTLDRYEGLLSMNYRISCDNWKSPEEFSSNEYEQDKRRFYKFMRRFDYKSEFRNVLSQVLRTGRGFYWLRTTEGVINNSPIDDSVEIKKLPYYTLQLLPQDICMITDKTQYGYSYDINLNYFLNGTTDINLYPPIFKDKLRNVFDGKNVKYDPASQNRNGEFATWIQTSPSEGAWVFVWDNNNANAIPPFSPLMKNVFDNTKIHELQFSKDLASAYALIYGEIGMMNNEKSGQKQNQTKFTPEVMGQFLNMVQGALKDIMRTVALPLENTRFGQFVDQNSNMELNALESSAGQGAYGSSAIFTTGKRNASEYLDGVTADYNLVSKLYSQFAKFCEYYGNKKTSKYKFHVTFDGCETQHEKDARRTAVKDLSDKGIILNASAFACAFGYDPYEFESMMAESSHGNMKDNLMLLLNSNTSKDGANSGRPEKSIGEISDSGVTSRDYQ